LLLNIIGGLAFLPILYYYFYGIFQFIEGVWFYKKSLHGLGVGVNNVSLFAAGGKE
jgi:hypothetical protein